jgi:hypothetical protein
MFLPSENLVWSNSTHCGSSVTRRELSLIYEYKTGFYKKQTETTPYYSFIFHPLKIFSALVYTVLWLCV